MAQAEDTELRDLVMEALEKNGSLAKIRALLRANIFLAFEDECENMKQNVNLDNILKLPEGILALSVIHEFLEFCCLKNTLFVYMSESRQGNEYKYDGKKSLSDRFNISKNDSIKEPILLTLIKNIHQKKPFNSNSSNLNNVDKNYGDSQNCTYILHEDSQSSNTSNSNSDNSSDEKNKLQLRLQLDNSDTDTSSDFARDKSSSEYIPGDHILESNHIIDQVSPQNSNDDGRAQNILFTNKSDKNLSVLQREFKINSSSDSTSYVELKPFNSLDEKMLNTTGLPIVEINMKNLSSQFQLGINTQNDTPPKLPTFNYLSPVSKKEKVENDDQKSSIKSDAETCDISYGDDFSSSSHSKSKDVTGNQLKSTESQKCGIEINSYINSLTGSPKKSSQNSPSSVSLSDVADLVSEKSSLGKDNKIVVNKVSKLNSDDSGDFTESPVPSLSNLSLDIHSD